MDVLRPELVWVEGRCYRKNPSRNNYGITRDNNNTGIGYDRNEPAGSSSSSLKPYEEDDNFDACDPDAPDEMDCSYEIEKLESGTFKTRCQNIPNGLYSVIVGAKGATKKRLEIETRTKIIIPFVNEKGDIVIRGQNKKDVITARRRIDLLVSRSRFKRDPTHFICFPLNCTTFVEKVKEFYELVSTEYSTLALASTLSKMFQDPQKMHLTICVLALLDNRERQLAAELLKNLKPDLLDCIRSNGANKCKVQMKGIEMMNDDPSQVDVLYAKCNLNDNTLQRMADLINERFLETGLAKPSKGTSVKLHATLINSRLAVEVEAEENGASNYSAQGSKRNSFDGRPILENKRFADFDFGTFDLNEVHLSVRYTTSKDGFYNCSAKITLVD